MDRRAVIVDNSTILCMLTKIDISSVGRSVLAVITGSIIRRVTTAVSSESPTVPGELLRAFKVEHRVSRIERCAHTYGSNSNYVSGRLC